MPTTKKRVNITLPADIEEALEILARRDNIPVATKAVQLLHIAIAIDEDEVFDAIAARRDTKKSHFVSHEKAWS